MWLDLRGALHSLVETMPEVNTPVRPSVYFLAKQRKPFVPILAETHP